MSSDAALLRQYIKAKKRESIGSFAATPFGMVAGYSSGTLFDVREGGAWSTLGAVSLGFLAKRLLQAYMTQKLGGEEAAKVLSQLFPHLPPLTEDVVGTLSEMLVLEPSAADLLIYSMEHPEKREAVSQIIKYRERKDSSFAARYDLYSQVFLAGFAAVHGFVRNNNSILWGSLWALGAAVVSPSVMVGVALSQGVKTEQKPQNLLLEDT